MWGFDILLDIWMINFVDLSPPWSLRNNKTCYDLGFLHYSHTHTNKNTDMQTNGQTDRHTVILFSGKLAYTNALHTNTESHKSTDRQTYLSYVLWLHEATNK